MIKNILLAILLPSAALAQTSSIFQLLGRHFTYENNLSLSNQLYHAAEDSAAQGVVCWQTNDGNLYARNTAHPESLNVYDEESGFGARMRTAYGIISGAIARRITENTLSLPVLADSLAVYTSCKFSNNVDKLLLQYSNQFWRNKIGLVVTLMPFFNEQNGGPNSALDNTDCAASLKVRYGFLPSTSASIMLLRDYYDKQVSFTMVQIASLGDLFAGNYLGNVATTRCRSFCTIDKLSGELRHELFAHWPVFISCEYNAFNTTHALYLDDMLDLHVRGMDWRVGTDYRGPSRFQYAVQYATSAYSGFASFWYRRSNGRYTPTLDMMRFTAGESGITATSGISMKSRQTFFAFLDLRYRHAGIVDFAYLDPTKYSVLTYGSKQVRGGGSTFCTNAGLGYCLACKADSVCARVLYLNTVPAGTLRTFDTWTGEYDTLRWSITRVHSLQIDIFNTYRCTDAVGLTIAVSQIIPLYVQKPAVQTTVAGESGPQNIKVSSYRDILGLLSCGVTLRYEIKRR